MAKPRSKDHEGLPKNWRQKGNAYYYRVPKGTEAHWDGKTEFKLGDSLSGCLERQVQVPAGAGAAEPRKGKIFARIALRDVPGGVDPQHEEGHAARTGTAQRRQPMGKLARADADCHDQPQGQALLHPRRKGCEQGLILRRRPAGPADRVSRLD